jgi:hypothetical protein
MLGLRGFASNREPLSGQGGFARSWRPSSSIVKFVCSRSDSSSIARSKVLGRLLAATLFRRSSPPDPARTFLLTPASTAFPRPSENGAAASKALRDSKTGGAGAGSSWILLAMLRVSYSQPNAKSTFDVSMHRYFARVADLW